MKINVIFRSDYFSFDIFSSISSQKTSWLNHDPLSEADSFFLPRFKFLTFFFFGAVRKILLFCIRSRDHPFRNLSETLMKRDFTAEVFLENGRNVQRSYFRIQHTPICWVFFFHSFKLLRKSFFFSVWLISSSNFILKDNNINVSKSAKYAQR